jgi:hypothetical protein
MQCEHTQSRIIGVWQVVDDCMQRVATVVIVVDFGGLDELRVGSVGEEWVWKIAKEVFEESGDRGNVVVEVCLVAEVNLRRVYVTGLARIMWGVDAMAYRDQIVPSFALCWAPSRKCGKCLRSRAQTCPRL